MKAKFFATFLMFFFIGDSSNSQTYFRLQYKSPAAKDTNTYDAFFCLYNNGTGFARVIFNSPFCSRKVAVNIDIQEDFAVNKDGLPDTSTLVYEGMNPKFIFNEKFSCRDSAKLKFTPITFCFKTNAANDRVPWGVTAAPANSIPPKPNFISPATVYIIPEELNMDMVKKFFVPGDEFYKKFIRPKGKGGVGLTAAERDSTMMFLTVVASTYDSTLMSDDRSQLPFPLVDARKIVKQFTAIASYLKITIIVDTVYGDRLSNKNVDEAIARIKPRRSLKDIVIFYFTGHGYNREIKGKIYDTPNIALFDISKPVPPDARDVNIQEIFETIRNKGAFINLVLSDCCNNLVGDRKPRVSAPPGPKGEPDKIFENYKTLFLKEPGNLLMTACLKGEKSAMYPPYNSLFTEFFLRSLKKYLSSDKPTGGGWFQLMGEATEMTSRIARGINCPGGAKCKQTPKLYVPALKLN